MTKKRKSMSAKCKPSEIESIDPTPQEIEARSAEIRRGWSDRVIRRRQAWNGPSWRPPLIRIIELISQMNEKQEQ